MKALEGESVPGMFFVGSSSTASMSFASKLNGWSSGNNFASASKEFLHDGHVV